MFLTELNESVRRRLDDLANIAANGDDHAVTEVARSEMPHLVEAVRRLMAEHEPNERGECPACSRVLRRWRRPLRRPKSPCRSISRRGGHCSTNARPSLVNPPVDVARAGSASARLPAPDPRGSRVARFDGAGFPSLPRPMAGIPDPCAVGRASPKEATMATILLIVLVALIALRCAYWLIYDRPSP